MKLITDVLHKKLPIKQSFMKISPIKVTLKAKITLNKWFIAAVKHNNIFSF